MLNTVLYCKIIVTSFFQNISKACFMILQIISHIIIKPHIINKIKSLVNKSLFWKPGSHFSDFYCSLPVLSFISHLFSFISHFLNYIIILSLFFIPFWSVCPYTSHFTYHLISCLISFFIFYSSN